MTTSDPTTAVAAKDAAERALKSLVRGLLSNSERTALRAYRQLHAIGPAAAPLVCEQLHKIDLARPHGREMHRLFSGLAALLRDVDETASNTFIAGALGRDCNAVLGSILRCVKAFSKGDYRRTRFGNIEIWVHAGVSEAYRAEEHIGRWLSRIPAGDLTGIHRVCVVPSSPTYDFSGTYLPILGVVTLVWDTKIGAAHPLYGLLRLYQRYVLLHEIGHHVNRHWFGLDPQQEAEADHYAYRSGKSLLTRVLSSVRKMTSSS